LTTQTVLLFTDHVSQKTLQTVPIDALSLSRFNTRATRTETDIARLATRIQQNGFEVTRALWVYPVDAGFEVFAGGTRLEASRHAGITEVPVVVHAGYDWDAISRLADEDNANDEYHTPVSLPDVWADYARLASAEGWTQQRIAAAKGVARSVVADRLGYADLPDVVQAHFVERDFLRESHAKELTGLSKFDNLAPWLTRAELMQEILTDVLDKHRGGSAGKAPTASVFQQRVNYANTMIRRAQEAVQTLAVPYPFLATLAAKNVRTAKDVDECYAQILKALEAEEFKRRREAEIQLAEITAEEQRLQDEQAKQALITKVLRCLAHGDCRTLIPAECPDNISLVVTDPPYGLAYQSHRRVVTPSPVSIIGDQSLDSACTLLQESLAILKGKLCPDAHLFVFTHQHSYSAFVEVLRQSGFTLRRTLTWQKGMHGLGDTTRGEVLTETEWILHAVQGNPKFQDGVNRHEIVSIPTTQETEHPAEKPDALLAHLIQLGSAPGDLVVDPFAGTGNTLLAALGEGRAGWACELDTTYYTRAAEKLYQFVEGGYGQPMATG
jgi:ParB/RepB/Spo0J family partition protein